MLKKLEKLRNDKRGIAWVLGVAVLSILLMPFVYFPLSYAWDQFYVAVTDSYVFTGVYANAIRVVQIIISYLVVFGLFYTINWAIVNAKARRYSP
jgi:hypothetical protein